MHIPKRRADHSPTGFDLAGRLQAVTDDCSAWPITQAAIIVDEWFSYSARGETTDVWESTRHSGGYYHSTASYWANGALNVLNPLNNTAVLPTITYGVDGEGRPNTAGASSGMNPVLSTAYDVASRATGVTLGSYDSDAFTFDANSGRMTQYKHTVGATPQSVIGNLTWNANGTLRSLGVTDPFNATNQQTCNYGYDDLTRINSANCGSPWSQTFGFDPFGNLTKSGSVSFQPTYNTATNRMQTLPGFTPTYDANGNTLTDSLHTYTWDVQGRVTAVDSVGLTYDALGRMVEQNRSGSYTQILYGPNGGKLALMNGQTVVKAFIPLPAGATAVYTAGPTLSYIRHPDWLGSSRFASTPARTMYSDLAYAPFGETYAEAGTADRSFTGQNQDTVGDSTAGLYDFLFREYAQYGRWISPDPAGIAAVDPADPQSWNRYAYVGNDVMNSVDPLGLLTTWAVYVVRINVYARQPGGNAASDPIAGSFLGSGGGLLRSRNATMLRPKDGPGEPAPANFSQCMAANSSTYSLAGLAQGAVNAALNTAGMSSVNFKDNPVVGAFLGNSISGTLFGSPGEAATSAATSTPGLLNMAMGTVTTYGRNTSTITSLNIARTGGLPQALSSASGGLKSVLGAADSVLSLGMSFSQRLAIDAALTGAEAAYCAYVTR